MVLGAPHALTKVSFRRDVRFFLATLVGFLVVLILVLLLLLQNAVLDTEVTIREQREIVADASAATINGLQSPRPEVLRGTLTVLQTRFRLATLSLTLPDGPTVRAGHDGPGVDTLTRRTTAGMLTIGFDAAPITSMRRQFFLTALIVVAAVISGTILLLLYTPKITRPIEQLLDEASSIALHDPEVDEQQYLVETFRKTIATLRMQEDELRHLHDQEKARADDFERVVAALTRSLSSGFIAVDPAGRVVDVNQSGREILRLDPGQEVIGRPLAEIAAPENFGEILQEATAARQSLTRREVESRTEDGQRLVIGLSTVPLMNEEGSFLGMLALFTDLTPIRDLEGRMREMQTLADLGEMSAGIAHEFRNSLSTILGYLKLAERQAAPEAMREKIRKAEEEASLLSSAITSLLNFTRPFTVELQQVDLRELVEGIISRLEPQAPGVAFSVEGSAEVEGDRGLLARAVENIVRNAIDAVRAAGEEGRVEIALQSDPPTVVVRDNGVGLGEGEVSRTAFVPFQSQKPGGIGLGLPLARKIALLHGGTVALAPRPGGGAVATIEFGPAARAPERTAAAREMLR
ncbi:MAG TPA: ATP-binding protein [Thermoanaerobaculia bacterium]|nr:ATP-binding protein [Thermoanaerobaculia bacterium]